MSSPKSASDRSSLPIVIGLISMAIGTMLAKYSSIGGGLIYGLGALLALLCMANIARDIICGD